MTRQLAILVMLLATIPVTAQWLTLPTPGVPRNADGTPDLSAPAPRTAQDRPDLSGLWVSRRVTGDLPDSGKFEGWANTLMDERAGRFFSDQPRYNCLPSGPSYLTAGNTSTGLRRIVQSPTIIAILHEDLVHRQIFMDGRELEADPLPTWMGYSVGRWDDDTLVVDSNGYNDKTWLDRRGAPHTEQLRITERYRRLDFGHIALEVTYEDPGAFESPLKVMIEMAFVADDELLEYVCNETSQLGSSWSGNITQTEATSADIAAEILANYVGTYEGVWLGNVITLEFTLQDGKLDLRRNGVDLRVVPQSETAFDASNGFGYIFTVGDGGVATEVSEIHVSGGWPFARVPD
jgi:hypothetical protein